jgi:Cu/Ag efflux protein CusF
MKRALVATVLAAAVAFTAGTVAWAADMEGTVKIIKINERVMTLSDGTQLYWTDKVQVQNIKEGMKVKATYEPQDGKLVLTKLEVVK